MISGFIRKIIALTVFLITCFGVAYAQRIQGTVAADSDKSAMEFVVVSLLSAKDSSHINSTTTNEKGQYEFNQLKAGTYLITASQIGFLKYFSPIIELTSDTAKLEQHVFLAEETTHTDEVVIQAKKPLFQQDAGKTTVDVQNSIASTGLMAIDLLRRMPGVIVDNDGNISLKGKSNVLIMIDGKPTYMSAKQIASILKSMPSAQISNIEIITSPSAKYDAQGDGGIININLKENLKQGFSGNLSATYGQGILSKQNYGISLGYNTKKWKLNTGYDYTNNKNVSAGYNNRTFGNINNKQTLHQDNYYTVPSETHNYSLSADYIVNKKFVIGMSHRGLVHHFAWDGGSTTNIKDSLSNIFKNTSVSEFSPGTYTSFSSGINGKYKFDSLGHELSADLDYIRYGEEYKINSTTLVSGSAPTGQAIFKSNLPFSVNTFAAKLDYQRKYFGNLEMESGLKWIGSSLSNDLNYDVLQTDSIVPAKPSSSKFLFQDQVSAAYLQFKWDSTSWSIQGGLRAEHWLAEGKDQATNATVSRNQLQLFPTFQAHYNLTTNQKLTLAYNRRIKRPSYYNLNPTSYFFDPYSYFHGNPNLYPQITNHVELAHSFKSAIITTINYSRTENYIYEYAVSQRTDGSNIMDMTVINIPYYENIGISMSFYFPVTSKWTCQLYGNVYQNHLRGYLSNTKTTIDNRYINATFNTTQDITLPKGFSAELTAQYTAPQLVGYTINNQLGMLSLGIKKNLFGGRGSVKLNFQDIFYTFKYSGNTEYDGYKADHLYRWDNRVVSLSLNWKLGSSWFIEKEGAKGAQLLENGK